MKMIRNASKVIHLEAPVPSELTDALKRQKYYFVGKYYAGGYTKH
jgi:hypothetical protein